MSLATPGRRGFPPAREDTADDFLDGDFLDVDVGNGELVQDVFADGNDTIAFDLEADAIDVLLEYLAVFAQVH